MFSDKQRKRALQALQVFLWIVAIYLGYATLDCLRLLEKDSRADYANLRSLMILDVSMTIIFAGLALSFLFVIGNLRTSLAKFKKTETPEVTQIEQAAKPD